MTELSCDEFRARLSAALDRKVDPELDPFEAELVWNRHLVSCEDCRNHLAMERRLEELLRTFPDPHLPEGLAARVRAALDPVRKRVREDDAKLDRLLRTMPEPEVPAELSTRVLAGLARERKKRRSRRPGGRLVRLGGLVAAAAALVLLIVVIRRQRPDEQTPEPIVERNLEADGDLVVYALENWELLMSEDVNVFLASLDPADAAFMELEDL